MITKQLSNLIIDKENFEIKYNNTENEDEKIMLKKEFINSLKLYLFESNKIIKETFSIGLTPYKNIEGQNALYNNSATDIITKTKEEFLIEIDKLKNSDLYYLLENEKKTLINNAFYVLITYYY